MSLSTQLLDQASHLATREPRRPKQASLRRAVSAAYYALFHYLIERAALQMVSGQNAAAIRATLSRAFAHGAMKETSKSFSKGMGKLPPVVQTALAGTVFPPDLAVVAQTFVELQEARHAADYDLAQPVIRQDALNLVARVQSALASWPAIEATAAGRYYLLALLVPGMMKGR